MEESSPFNPIEIISSLFLLLNDLKDDSDVDLSIYFLKFSTHFSFGCLLSISSTFFSSMLIYFILINSNEII